MTANSKIYYVWHHDLTEYVLGRANSLKPTVVVPEQNDLIIKFDP